MNKIPIYLESTQIQGDTTQFMQQSVHFKIKDALTVVYLDPIKEYFDNPEISKYWEEMTVWEVSSNGNKPQLSEDLVPVLTLQGVARIRELVQDILTPHHPYADVVDEDEFDFE